MPRVGNRGANHSKGYLDELAGQAGRGPSGTELACPTYRSAVDPAFDPKGNREYRPNNKVGSKLRADPGSDHPKISRIFRREGPQEGERPCSRIINRTRSNVSRAMSGRREDPARALDAATADDFAENRSASPARRADALPGTADGKPRSSSSRRSLSTRALPGRRRQPSRRGLDSTASAGLSPGGTSRGTSRRRRPSEVLDRSRRLNSSGDLQACPRRARRGGLGSGSTAALRFPASRVNENR